MPTPGFDEGLRPSFSQRVSLVFEHRWFVPAVAGLGLLFRIALLVVTAKHSVFFKDEEDYQAIAMSIWKTHQFAELGSLTAFRPPGEPFFIAAIYAVLGYGPHIVGLVQTVLLTFVPFLCTALGRRIGLSVRAANVAALLASFHPGLAYASTTLYPTALTAVALTAGLLYCSIAAETDNKSESVKGGLALGLAGLATTTFVPLPVLAAFYCFWKRRFRAAVIICTLGMLPAVVWLIRNDRVFGEFTIATNGGLNLFLGANDESTPLSGNRIDLPPDDPATDGASEVVKDRMWSGRAITWIRIHPMRYTRLCFERGALVVDSVGKPKTQGIHSGIGAKLVGWALFPIVFLGLVGLVAKRSKAASFITAAALLLVVVSSAVTLVKPRFRFPCDPVLSVFAVAAVPGMLSLFGRRQQHSKAISDAGSLTETTG